MNPFKFKSASKTSVIAIAMTVLFSGTFAFADSFENNEAWRAMNEDLAVAVHDDGQYAIMNWNPEIPASATDLLTNLQEGGQYYSYEGDEARCGGEILAASLREHRKVLTSDGLPLHVVKVRFEMTMPVDYCASEKVVRCEIRYKIANPHEIDYSTWKCQDI